MSEVEVWMLLIVVPLAVSWLTYFIWFKDMKWYEAKFSRAFMVWGGFSCVYIPLSVIAFICRTIWKAWFS